MNSQMLPHRGPQNNSSVTAAGFARRMSSAPAGSSNPSRGEVITIPAPSRETPASSLALSARLARLFEASGIRRLGDLHGKAFSDFNEFANNGPKTQQDLRDLVRLIREQRTLPLVDRLSIPAAARDLNPFEFPLSVRLESALRAKNIQHFGDLEGLALKELKQLRNCGWLTIRELVRLLERISEGEFALRGKLGSPAMFANLLSKLDQNLGALRERDRKTVLLRLGEGKVGRGWTLNQIGMRFHITRECVRQDLERIVPMIRKAGGPEMVAQLDYISSKCLEGVYPFTVPLLTKWMSGAPSSRKFSMPFYVRLLGELHPQLPAWPNGQDPARPWTKRVEPLTGVLEEILEGHEGMPAQDAFRRTAAHPKTRNIGAGPFLETLKRSRNICVEFPKPEQPVLSVRRRALAK